MSYLFPKMPVVIRSPVINFKNTGNTILFTTKANQTLLLCQYIQYCTSSTAPGTDAAFNLGWTGAAYDDFQASVNMDATTPNAFIVENITSVTGVPVVPPNTSFRINITGADSGTALSGSIIFLAFEV